MKVAVPCAAALALFPFVSAFPAPAPTAGPGELDIIKRGLVVREARGLQPRQGGGTTRAPATAADPSPSPTAAQPTATPPTQQAPTTTSGAYQLFSILRLTNFYIFQRPVRAQIRLLRPSSPPELHRLAQPPQTPPPPPPRCHPSSARRLPRLK